MNQTLLSRFGNAFQRVENALNALKESRGIMVTDNEDRENEGDMIFAAQSLTNTQMAMMIREGSGIVCLCLTDERVEVTFTVRGMHDFMWEGIPALLKKGNIDPENRKEACARRVGKNYYIKVNTFGDVFNPTDNTHLNSSRKKYNNMPVWRFVKVGYTPFAHYVHFLKTRNTSYLSFTRRDFGD